MLPVPMSLKAPDVAAALATESEVVPDAASTIAEVEPDTGVPDPGLEPPPPDPLGFDWRAHRLFELDDSAVPDRPAVMRVVVTNPTDDGRVMGTAVIPDYSRFFLQGVSEQDTEKAHIVETFGSYWVHLFGRKPRVFMFSGTLLSAPGQDWEAGWDMLYDRYLRGTKCVEMGTQAQMTYGRRSVYGYILGTSKTGAAVADMSVSFSFSMLVTHVEWINAGRVLESQFGVKSIDGLVAQGDLQSLDGVGAAVAARDSAAGEATAAILAGNGRPADVAPATDQAAALAAETVPSP